MGYKGLEIPQKGHKIVHTFQGLFTLAKASTQHSKPWTLARPLSHNGDKKKLQ